MAFIDTSHRGIIAYLTVLIAALALATDNQSMTRTPRLP
jgi:hypothetical protein